MRRQSTERLPTAVAIATAGALVAVLAGVPEAALFAAPWFVLLVLGLGSRNRLDVSSRVSVANDRILVGDEVELDALVAASGPGIVKAQVIAPSAFFEAGGTAVDAPTVMVGATAPGQPAAFDLSVAGASWGTHDFGKIDVEFTEPFGLFRRIGVGYEPASVRVHPTPIQLQELLAPWMVRRVSGTHASRDAGEGVEYADIRPFVAGDSVRNINWRASARSDGLWVSQRHPDRATDVVLLVDSFVESGHDVRRIFGLAVEASIALAESHLSATDRVGLIEFGGLVSWVSPSTGRVQLQRLTDALLGTRLYANAADKELPIMPPRALPPRSFVVALTPLLDRRFVGALYAARGRGHDVAVIECVPRVQPAIENGEDEVAPAGAALWKAERAMLRDEMAGHGISVGTWNEGDHLDVTLTHLIRTRRGAARVGGR